MTIEKFSDLTEDERVTLAYHALSASQMQDDFRYQHPDKVVRNELRARWREISDALRPPLDLEDLESSPSGPGPSSPSV